MNEISKAAQILGRIKTKKKSLASAENGRKWGGRPKGSKNKIKNIDKKTNVS